MSARGARDQKSPFSASGGGPRDPHGSIWGVEISQNPDLELQGMEFRQISDENLMVGLIKRVQSGGRQQQLFRSFRGSRTHVFHEALRALRGARDPRRLRKSCY